jgi:hypothetical protein
MMEGDDDILRTAITPLRVLLLEDAAHITGTERNAVYGEPVENHQHIARIFNAITRRDVTGNGLTAADIVMVLRAVKLARQQAAPLHRDSYVDEMAYTGIAYECVDAEARG